MAGMLYNPILPGFYPDPSVCRRGNDCYLVTSTFEYFPGIPLFHSRDFVHWHQIGHVLTRPEQLNLDGIPASKGIYASSVFYNKDRGRFYVITTLVGKGGYYDNVNFFVWSHNPEGPWSDPVVVKGAEGIDPSLVFDKEKVYYLGNRRPFPEQPERGRHIWMQEMDLETGELVGERYTLLTHGTTVNAAAPEGPHIYHIGDWYYLMIAEGGTFRNHAVSIFRSRNVTGPYEANPGNPLITHRHLGRDYPVRNPGHGDLMELPSGEWWAVLLATRQDGGDYGNLGRETFAVPVIWVDEWPVLSPETGRVESAYPAPELDELVWEEEKTLDEFEGEELELYWITVRTPRHRMYSLTERPGHLRMFLHENSIKDGSFCSFLGRRQRHLCFLAEAAMDFEPEMNGETAGIMLLLNQDYHLRVEYGLFDGRREVRLTRCFGGVDEVLACLAWECRRMKIRVVAVYQDFCFFVTETAELAKMPEMAEGSVTADVVAAGECKEWKELGSHVDGTLLCRETAGGYTGTVLGMYGSSNGRKSHNHVDYDWFLYREMER